MNARFPKRINIRGFFMRRKLAVPGTPLVVLFAALIAVCPGTASAQVDTGSITGTVADASGAVVPGASVTITEQSTSQKQTQTTGPDGSYTFSPVKIGTYTLTVEKHGFRTMVQKNIQVTVQGHLEISPKLEVGEVGQEVTVTAGVPLLETQSSSIQQLVGVRAINSLPLNGRNATFLAQQSAGVTMAQNDSRGLQASGSFTANGTRRTQNDYLLDGMDDNVAIADLVNQTQYVILPPPDGIREFTVQTNDYSAEFGHSAGAVLNITTKSGGNAFHGDIWEFMRNDVFDAEDYFVLKTQSKPEFHLNQFGGTVGGPIIIPRVYNGHNRTFFFVDYQGTRIAQGKTYTESVPTVAESSSGFTNLQDLISLQTGTHSDALSRVFPVGTVFDPATTRSIPASGVDPVTGLSGTPGSYVRDPFYSGSLMGMTNFTSSTAEAELNQIPANRLDPGAVALMQLYPKPNTAALVNNYTSNPANHTGLNSFDVRFDQNFSQRDLAFLRYGYAYQTQSVPGPFPGAADGEPARPASGDTESQNVALSETHIFNERLVNEARVGFSRVADARRQFDANVLGVPEQYGIPGIPQVPTNGGLPLFGFNQLSNLGTPGSLPSDKASDIAQFTENLTHSRGRHMLRAGFEYQHIGLPMLTPNASRGNFTNNGEYTSIVSNTDPSTDRAQIVIVPGASTVPNGVSGLGGSNSVAASNLAPSFKVARQYFGAYIEDTWRATAKLTVNPGLRWEHYGVPAETGGRFASLVPAQSGTTPDGISRFYIPQSQASNVPAAFQMQLANDGIVFTPIAQNTIASAQDLNFAPRIGFSLQVLPKLVVRGGYGMFFQGSENLGLNASPWFNFPFSINADYIAGSSITPPAPNGSVGPITEGLTNVGLTPTTVSLNAIAVEGQERHPKSSYAQDYNLQVQYEVSPNTLAFVGYVGTNSRHEEVLIDDNTVNTIQPPTVNDKAIAFFPDFSYGGNFIRNIGEGDYNSLQTGVEHRFSHGLSLLANFTYSKCLSDAHDLLDNNVGGYRAPYVTGMGIRADYTLCDINTPLLFHTSGSYVLPFGRGQSFLQSGVPAALAGGWSLNWIMTAQDGQPFSIACTTSNASGLGCFALKVPGQNPYAGSHNVLHFLNSNAFANPPVATSSSASIADLGGPPAQVSGPPFRRLDTSVFRQFPTGAERYFEFRAEVFNVTNTPNFAQPGSLNFTSPTSFASITATRDNPNDPREIQFALKYYF